MIDDFICFLRVTFFLLSLSETRKIHTKERVVKSSDKIHIEALPQLWESGGRCDEKEYDWPCGGDGYQNVLNYSTCIKFYKNASTWKQAFDICNSDGASLVTIKSLEFDKALHTLAPNDIKKVYWWIGLRKSKAKTWYWISDPTKSKVPKYNHFWDKNRYTCVATNYNSSNIWRDLNCVIPFPFICERYSSEDIFNNGGEQFRIQMKVAVREQEKVVAFDCTALVDPMGQIRFRFISPTLITAISSSDSRISIKERGVYKYVRVLTRNHKGYMHNSAERCMRLWRSELILKFSAQLNKRKVECCSVRRSGLAVCSAPNEPLPNIALGYTKRPKDHTTTTLRPQKIPNDRMNITKHPQTRPKYHITTTLRPQKIPKDRMNITKHPKKIPKDRMNITRHPTERSKERINADAYKIVIYVLPVFWLIALLVAVVTIYCRRSRRQETESDKRDPRDKAAGGETSKNSSIKTTSNVDVGSVGTDISSSGTSVDTSTGTIDSFSSQYSQSSNDIGDVDG